MSASRRSAPASISVSDAERDPYARGHERLEPVEVERLVQGADHAFGDVFRLGDVGKVLTEHDELIAAEPGDGVADSDHRSNPLGSLPEKDVSRLVTETVVHHLEVVEVEEQHRERAAPPADEIDRVLGTVEKEHSVRKVGQRVVRGLVRELGLGTRRLLARPVRRVEEHGETSDDDRGHDCGDEDDHDLVHVVAERRTRRREHRREEQRCREQQQPRRMDARTSEMLGGSCDRLSRGVRGGEREHAEAHHVPGVDPLRRGVAVQQTDRVLCEIRGEHQRETGAEEPDRSTSSPGHEQQPEQRGDEHDVEKRIRREHRPLEDVPVVHESGVHDEELPDREPGRHRDRRAVDETVAPSLRCADHDEQSDGTRDQRIGQQVQAVGGRNGGTPATEQRVHLPDGSSHDDHAHRECEQVPRLSRVSWRHDGTQEERARGTCSGCDRRDRRSLRARREDHHCGEGEG